MYNKNADKNICNRDAYSTNAFLAYEVESVMEGGEHGGTQR